MTKYLMSVVLLSTALATGCGGSNETPQNPETPAAPAPAAEPAPPPEAPPPAAAPAAPAPRPSAPRQSAAPSRPAAPAPAPPPANVDRKSTRLNSSHSQISYAVFCLKKKKYIVSHSLL